MAEKISSNNHILVLVPGSNARGGITNYYSSLKNHFTLPVDYLERGARTWPVRKSVIFEYSRIIKDTWKFFKLIRTKKYQLVQTTTAFSSLALFRDGLFIILAKFYHVKVIVFYRGWDKNLAVKIENKYLGIFKKIYFRADAVIDLASENIKRIQSWGYTRPCYLETTVVDQRLISGINEDFVKSRALRKASGFNLLFLSRIEITKGVYEAIDTYEILKKKYNHISMTIAGDGFELDNIKSYINQHNLTDISIVGFVEKKVKAEIYRKADIFIFPSYFEGMPNALLEAMSFGLPVITRPVGGVRDFFVHEKNGYITESKDPVVFADFVEKLLINHNLYEEISVHNYHYAMNNFISNVVVGRIEKIFKDTLDR
jgi:glycosyltransferase involved in cell wall biosynthesis